MSTQKIAYLGNLVRVMVADDTIAASEEKILKSLCKQMKVPVSTLVDLQKKAKKMKKLKPMSRFSKTINNIEDCFAVAICDGVFDMEEKKLIYELAKSLKLDQYHIEKIYLDAVKRLKMDPNEVLHEG